MLTHLRPAIMLLAFFTILTGLAYPLAVTGLAQVLVPSQANGSLIEKNGTVVGSALIGQAFTGDQYFHGRPSAAGTGYDASASSGSNLGPTSKKLIDRIKADADTLKAATGAEKLPADAVTASASGLDPDISPAYAGLQINRIAAARKLNEEKIRDLVSLYTREPTLGLVGEPRVNVFLLNLALDGEAMGRSG